MTGRRRRLSLDAPTVSGRSLHESVAAPAAGEDATDDAEDACDEQGARRAVVGAYAAAARLSRDRAVADNLAERLRAAESAANAYANHLAELHLGVVMGARLVGLSDAQLRIVQAELTLAENGERASHQAIADFLGLGPKGRANVCTQRRRIIAKLRAAQARDERCLHPGDCLPEAG